MHVYHISYGWKETDKLFTPRVPKSLANDYKEDNITPRVCVSASIDGAFTGAQDHPYTTYDLKPVTVYEADVDEAELIAPAELYRSGRVLDALASEEYWVTKPIHMSGKHLYLRGFESSNYLVPDEKKQPDVVMYILHHAKGNFTLSDIKEMSHKTVDSLLRDYIPRNWRWIGVSEDDVADEFGFPNIRTMLHCELLDGE